MSDTTDDSSMQDLSVTLWVGKDGIDEGVIDELANQLETREAVKLRVLRSGRTEGSIESIAAELADAVGGTVGATRGHTAVITQ